MQITAGKLVKILKEQGIDEADRQAIIKEIEGEELDEVIKEVKEEKIKGKEDQLKNNNSAELARELGYKGDK